MNMAEQDELTLVERVFLRIGSAETDEQLESLVHKFLPPILLKLSSQQEGVRKKVMELLVHLNKRLKSRPCVQVPVDTLLVQYQDPAASPFVVNFTILYIKMGFPRLPVDKQTDLLPTLMRCLEDKPQPQQDSLLLLMMPAMGQLKISHSSSAAVKAEYSFIVDQPKSMKLLLDFMLDVLLLPYSFTPTQATGTERSGNNSSNVSGGRDASAPPAMSPQAYKRVTGDAPLTQDTLEKTKIGIVNFLGSGVFAEEDVVYHFVVALADTRHSVSSAADMEIKRITGSVDWNKSAVIAKLYTIFHGTINIKGEKSGPRPEQRRSPAPVRLKLKIFPYLLRSRESANQLASCMQVIFDCLFGSSTNPKLKTLAVQMVHHVCYNVADVSHFRSIGSILLSGMIKLIADAKDDGRLRGLAYVAVGKIVKRLPDVLSKNFALVQTFFEALTQEESETRLAVQEALSTMSAAFKELSVSHRTLLEALIMQNVEKPEVHCRAMAVQYARVVFPADHISSRYVLLLACGDKREEVYVEASKALRAPSDEESVEAWTTPAFPELVTYIHEKAAQRVRSSSKYVMGTNVLPFNPATFAEILMYLRTCLAHSGGVTPNLESTSGMQNQSPVIGRYLRKLLTYDLGDKGPVQLYVNLIVQLLSAIGGAPAMYCLLEAVAVIPDVLAVQFKKLSWLQTFVFSTREDMRDYAAQLYAVVVQSCLKDPQIQEIVSSLTGNLSKESLEKQHGSILALAHIIGRRYLAARAPSCGDLSVEDMEVEVTGQSAGEPLGELKGCMTEAVRCIAMFLESSQSVTLVLAACTALSEVGRTGPLLLPDGEAETAVIDSKLGVVKNLVAKVKSSKEANKVREKAALTLGLICVGDANFCCRRKIITDLLDSAQAKQLELHFTVGEALVYAAEGVRSSMGRDLWTVEEKDYKPVISNSVDDVEWLLDMLLTKYITSANPHIRQAACVWLLTVIQKCGQYPAVQKKVDSVQAAFVSLLSENDEMTQDVASKGLGVVYEQCDSAQKDKLVSELVDTLMTGKRAQKPVSGDTKVFSEGELGTTPEGKNLSTYKELCSIANDLNQPDLIYKFMHLANHNAVWNSKKGAAFGFSTIAAQAGQQMAPYLGQIVPRLYRYQFDPNPRIQQAMTSIWNSLVTDNKGTVEKYLRDIMTDLVKNLTNGQWRVRESSCMAVNDLLRGRPLDDVIDQLGALWETLLKVLDDIKESVRKAAEVACKTLSRVSIRICDVNNGSVGEQAVSTVLPTLLKSGLASSVQEVRAISLQTLVKMSKNAGSHLKPHISLLVVALLESLSNLEPQMLNYLSLQVASNQSALDKLDTARISASKSTPMMETINLCVQYVDTTTLPQLVPRLTEIIRSGIGIGTKAGCASFIVSIVRQCPLDVTPFAGKLLAALLNGLGDRSAAVRKSYAGAIGNLVKVAKDTSVEKLINRLKTWYMEKEDETVRQACGVTLQAIGQNSPDVLKRHSAQALPLVFLAMHEEGDNKAIWEEVWLDATPGTEGGIRLLLTELVDITQTASQSQSWLMKAQAASAMSTVASKLGSSLTQPHLGALLAALLSGLTGRTWTGKETLLKAISSVCVKCRSSLEGCTSEPTLAQICEAIMKECRKENIDYKMEAVTCLTSILETYDIDRYEQVTSIVLPVLTKTMSEDQSENYGRDKTESIKCTCFQALGKAWPDNKDTQDLLQSTVSHTLCSHIVTSTWKEQSAILKALAKLVSRWRVLESATEFEARRDIIIDILSEMLPLVTQCLDNIKYSVLRTDALEVTEVVAAGLKAIGKLDVIEQATRDKLVQSLDVMASDSKMELQPRALMVKKYLEELS